MKIQVSMSDACGTFAMQGVEAEENAQLLFASFLPMAGLPESKPLVTNTSNANVEFMADDISPATVNLPMGFEISELQNSRTDIALSSVSDTDASALLAPKEMNSSVVANAAIGRTPGVDDVSSQIISANKPVFSEINPNLLPNMLEQINTASIDARNVLKADNNVYADAGIVVDTVLSKKEGASPLDADLPEQPMDDTGLQQKDEFDARTSLEKIPVDLTPLVKSILPEISTSQIKSRGNEVSPPKGNEQEAIDTRVTFNAIDSVKPMAIEDSAQQNTQSYDALLTNVADFFNKRVAIMDPAPVKNKMDGVSMNTASFREVENTSALRAFQYSSNGVPSTLKVDSHFATLKVYPPDLGQITAEIQMNKGMTELTLRADNPQVRHFIETNLQQLRESFENSNINLGQVNVQNHSAEDKHGFQRNHNPAFANMDTPHKPDTDRPKARAETPRSNSLIDTYA